MDTVLQLTRLGGPIFALNPDLIERAEATPDTVVTLVNGSRYVIRESLDELSELINDYRAGIIAAAQTLTDRSRVAGPRDISPRDTTSRDITPRDITPRDITPRDISPRDISSRDSTTRDGGTCDHNSSTRAPVVVLHPGER